MKGRIVKFRRQTREQDREDVGRTEHYIIEGTGDAYLGYLTLRDRAPELAATVLVSEDALWETAEGTDIVRAIERYAFEARHFSAVAVEVKAGAAGAQKRLEGCGFLARGVRGAHVVLVKSRAGEPAPAPAKT